MLNTKCMSAEQSMHTRVHMWKLNNNSYFRTNSHFVFTYTSVTFNSNVTNTVMLLYWICEERIKKKKNSNIIRSYNVIPKRTVQVTRFPASQVQFPCDVFSIIFPKKSEIRVHRTSHKNGSTKSQINQRTLCVKVILRTNHKKKKHYEFSIFETKLRKFNYFYRHWQRVFWKSILKMRPVTGDGCFSQWLPFTDGLPTIKFSNLYSFIRCRLIFSYTTMKQSKTINSVSLYVDKFKSSINYIWHIFLWNLSWVFIQLDMYSYKIKHKSLQNIKMSGKSWVRVLQKCKIKAKFFIFFFFLT